MTGQVFHIGEIAALLLVAYVIGWAVGYGLHRITARGARVTRMEAAQAGPPVGTSPGFSSVIAGAATSAPVVASATAPVEIAAAIPEATRANPLPANAQPIVSPAPISGLETLRSLSVAMPLVSVASPATCDVPNPDAPAPALPVTGEGTDVDATVAAEPTASETSLPGPATTSADTADTPEPSSAWPATAAGVAWSGVLGGHEAEHFEPITSAAGPIAELTKVPEVAEAELDPPSTSRSTAANAAEEPDPPTVAEAALDVAMLDAIASELAPATAVGPAEAAVGAGASAGPRTVPATAVDTPSDPGDAAGPDGLSQSAPDEDSAMRDIEGGWSRRGGRSAATDLTDVSAAVNAAQFAVEQVLARSGISAGTPEDRGQINFGKPRGLPRPRDGGRDDLKQIAGLGPMDESALNNLGIYHFDQIANLDDREVLWLENHAFARGRIGRENWQQQARELGAETASLRVGR